MVVCSTGEQGTVLVPFFFTLYTAAFRDNSANCHLQKFSKDFTIILTRLIATICNTFMKAKVALEFWCQTI